jgi:hypothetical protein
MTYYNCPRCALSIKVRAPYLTLTSCPRCLARSKLAVPLYETPEPVRPSLFRRPERKAARAV